MNYEKLIEDRFNESNIIKTEISIDAEEKWKDHKKEYESGLSQTSMEMKKFKAMISLHEYKKAIAKNKKPEIKKKLTTTRIDDPEELEEKIKEFNEKKPWSRLLVAIKKEKIRNYFSENGMEPPQEEWLFLVTNKKLPEVKITYDTETQKITNIKGI